MNITTEQALIVLLTGFIFLVFLTSEDVVSQRLFCLADERIAVIPILTFEVCRVRLSETEADGFPLKIKHPPKCNAPCKGNDLRSFFYIEILFLNSYYRNENKITKI